jgi:hypothetical protein
VKSWSGGHAWLLSFGALSVTGLVSWAGLRQWTVPTAPPGSPRLAAETARRALPRVSTLYERQASAYQAGLFADESSVVLVTPTGFTTIRPGKTPQERAVDLGPIAVRDGGSIIFWRSGGLREMALSGEGERELAALPSPPRYLLAFEGRLAWVQSDRTTGSSLQTLSGDGVSVVHDSRDSVCASVMQGASVYWVLQRADGSWTIERISLDEQNRVSTAAHRGRPPAMLAVGRDGVYFYDGPERGVRRLTFDLAREDALATNVICSPLAVSSRVVCAHVGGLFEIPASGTAPRFLASESAGPIAATAATDGRAFWVAENGDGRLVVRSAPFSKP